MDKRLLGKCGFYCGCCPTYIEGGCKGCLEEHSEGDCYSRDCVLRKGVSCCGECSEFPCETILTRPRTTVLDKAWLQWKKSTKKNSNKEELLFYNEYEEFYAMAEKSNAFRSFCRDAFGEDFSQDGFSDIKQIDWILQYVPSKDNVHILDIGCGNGKMLGYLQKKTGAYIHGFDYSEKAIRTACKLFPVNSEFREGIIGEIEYPKNSFDVITSMDTVYFAKDMNAFVAQIYQWLREDGVFFVGYQEGEVMPRTENTDTTVFAKALKSNGISYEVTDITEQTYELLRKKRISAIVHQPEFEAEGRRSWYDMLMAQTEYVAEPYERFKEKMARYIYVVRK